MPVAPAAASGAALAGIGLVPVSLLRPGRGPPGNVGVRPDRVLPLGDRVARLPFCWIPRRRLPFRQMPFRRLSGRWIPGRRLAFRRIPSR